jgi:nicotinamidase-related amidase
MKLIQANLTNSGVESTGRQGSGLGFAFVIVEDACGAEILRERLPSSVWKIAAVAPLGSLLSQQPDGCKCVALQPCC